MEPLLNATAVPNRRTPARPVLSPHHAHEPTDRWALAARVREATNRTCRWLINEQHPDGYWCGELEGDSILQSEYILLLAWLGEEQSDKARKAARHLLEQQQPHGGWALFPGGDLEISASVKAYLALKLTGHDPESDYMRRAREAIREHGGADRVNSFTRFYLALLGQIEYDQCPAVPPEAMLLPRWAPINIYRISAWSRTILVPLSIMWAFRPCRQLPAEMGIEELMLQPPDRWPRLRCPGRAEGPGLLSWERFFHGVDRVLKLVEKYRFRPFRRQALQSAERWMLDRFADSDGLGAIFPPIVWSIVALKCLGYADESSEVRYCREQLDDLILDDGDGSLRLQPCKSPVWDTALVLRGLTASGSDGDEPARQAAEWLLEREVRFAGDWSATVDAEPSGWFFEHRNKFYPDIDDTIMVMMAFGEQSRRSAPGPAEPAAMAIGERAKEACERARRWTLAMQNRDGGWGAFDKDNDMELLCAVPFADHNAMIDPSTPDITGRVLEALAGCGMRRGDPAIDRAITYVRCTQEPDGSWYGRWGVNHIYGTWQALVGLSRIGVPTNDPVITRGADWLLRHQKPCGGWGESARSYSDGRYRGRGPITASQTSWALLGLIAAGRADHPAVTRGIEYLVRQQREDGTWDEPEFTGTGFPLVFYLRYHLYPIYFPLLALAAWSQSVVDASSVHAARVGESEVAHASSVHAVWDGDCERGN